MTFETNIASCSISAFAYIEAISDFIDNEYGTKYNDCKMHDKIEKLSDEIKYEDDFAIVERIYDLACDEYPKIKQHRYLNPYLRHVDVFKVFDDLFSINIVETLSNLYEDEEFDNKINDVEHKLIVIAPSCDQIIKLLIHEDEFDEQDEFDYCDLWWKPKNEFLNKDYERLFNAVSDVYPNIFFKNITYYYKIYVHTKNAFEYEYEIIHYVHECLGIPMETIENIRDSVVNNQIGFNAIEKFYDALCEKFSSLKNETTLDPHIKLVNSYKVFNGAINEYIKKPIIKKFEPKEQDERLQQLKKELLTLFPECEKIIVPFMEHSNISDNSQYWQIPQNVMFSKPYVDLYFHIIKIKI